MRHLYADCVSANTYSFTHDKKDAIALLMIGADASSGATYFGTSDTTTSPATVLKAFKNVLISTLNSGYSGEVTLYSTNTYAVKVFTSWMKGWLKQGGVEVTWLTSKKEPVANQDIIKEVLSLMHRFSSVEVVAIESKTPLAESTVANVRTLRSAGAAENWVASTSFAPIATEAMAPVAPAVAPVAVEPVAVAPALSVAPIGAPAGTETSPHKISAPMEAESAPKSKPEPKLASGTYPGAQDAMHLALATLAALVPTTSTFTLADGVTITITK